MQRCAGVPGRVAALLALLAAACGRLRFVGYLQVLDAAMQLDYFIQIHSGP